MQGTHTNWTCDLQVVASRVTFTGYGVRDYEIPRPNERPMNRLLLFTRRVTRCSFRRSLQPKEERYSARRLIHEA
jgi:hypothetical protein